MTKAPAFQFYVRDWLSDPQLRQASPASRGIWIDLLCFMWEAPERGKIEGSVENIARMIGVTTEEMTGFLEEVKTLKFADVTFCNKNVTLINRRMMREQKAKENTRLRVQRHREKQACNAKITPSSSSSSSCTKVHSTELLRNSVCPEPKKNRSGPDKKISHQEYIAQTYEEAKVLLADHYELWSGAYPGVNLEQEVNRAVAWLEANPQNRKKNIKRFLINWLSRAQDRGARFPNGNQRASPAQARTMGTLQTLYEWGEQDDQRKLSK